jgi:hypothetical protein
MSRKNLDLTLLMYEVFNRRDLDAMLALMHDEVEIESRLVALEGCYHGHEGVRRWWNNLLDGLPDYKKPLSCRPQTAAQRIDCGQGEFSIDGNDSGGCAQRALPS